MASATDFAKMVPGLDFLQGLLKGAGAALPGMGQWVAPTLDPKELERRIEELRTVQFWLEQNARLLGTTIQALEVQRMTLATLQTMNLPLAQVRDAIQAPVTAAAAAAAAPAAKPAAAKAMPGKPAPAQAATGARRATRPAAAAAAPGAAAGKGSPLVDPMQWWGALTQQFTELAAKALKEGGAETARQPASAAASPGPAAVAAAVAAPAAPPRRARRR
ncbi:MAG: PhaM family polyhydroxyalkanoate granule multifunctional regulatory protein [Pseudomonadota bacterium]